MRVIIIFLLFKVSICFSQDLNQSITIDNFDSQIMHFNFSNLNKVSDDDYKNASASLKQIEKSILNKNGEFSGSIYWNYCHVFFKLKHFDLIEASLVKAFNSDDPVICELFKLGHAAIYQPYIQVGVWNNFESQCDEIIESFDQISNDKLKNKQVTSGDIQYYQ